MKNWLLNKIRSLIGTMPKSNKTDENAQLDVLADAVSDVGYWTWWTTSSKDILQIEFGGTQLYFPPTDVSQPPPTRIAIQFRKVMSASFLNRHDMAHDDFGWSQLLQKDEMEPPNCSHGEFIFNNTELLEKLLAQVNGYEAIMGYKPDDTRFHNEPYRLVFWCGTDIGMAIAAKELRLINHQGEVPIAEVTKINERWWKYWRTYWDKKDTEDALPGDYACEVTIPAGTPFKVKIDGDETPS